MIPISKNSEQWKRKSYFSLTCFEQGYLSNQYRKGLENSGIVLRVGFEGSVSQTYNLGPSFSFMLCRNKYFGKIPKIN